MHDVTSEFEVIGQGLEDAGLLCADTLVMVGGGGVKVVFDHEGHLVRSDLFRHVRAPFTVFSTGTYSLAFAKEGRPLRASTDDMAQMFGPKLACVELGRVRGSSVLVKDKGFMVTGRYPAELVAAATLVEKACRAELLVPAIGELHYLNDALSVAEHAVYLASYSKHEKEATSDDA